MNRRPPTQPRERPDFVPAEPLACSSVTNGQGRLLDPFLRPPSLRAQTPHPPSQGAGILNLREVPNSPRLTLCMKMDTAAPWKGARAPSLHSPPRTGPLVPSPGFQPHAWLLGHI